MRYKLKIDLLLLIPAVVLLVMSMTVLASINMSYLKAQMLSLAAALVAFLIVTQFDPRLLARLKVPFYIFSVACLLVVLVLGIESRGAVRWIELFGFRLQLSEIFKPLLSIVLAAHISGEEQLDLKKFLSSIFFLAIIGVLIYLQPDLGNALIYAGVFLLTLVVVGFPLKWFGLLALPFLVISPFLWNMLHDYQRQRIMTFLYPHNDPLGTSYNSIQALIAVGSGMIFGKGLGESTQSGLQFLPERQTDFIFATLSEGTGLIGGLIVIAAFAFLLFRIYRIFSLSRVLYEKVFAACAFFFFLVQFVMNVGMNIGVLPVVGVTLPFVSFGGSSLVANFIFLGLLSSISVSNDKKNSLEI